MMSAGDEQRAVCRRRTAFRPSLPQQPRLPAELAGLAAADGQQQPRAGLPPPNAGSSVARTSAAEWMGLIARALPLSSFKSALNETWSRGSRSNTPLIDSPPQIAATGPPEARPSS